MKNKILFLIALITISFGCTQEPDIVFFASFRGNGEDGLHLSYSKDGYEWTTLNNDKTFLKPTVGESVLMRDPCVIYGPDKKFHMVWTSGWNEHGIGYANSTDLVNWSGYSGSYHPGIRRIPPRLSN